MLKHQNKSDSFVRSLFGNVVALMCANSPRIMPENDSNLKLTLKPSGRSRSLDRLSNRQIPLCKCDFSRFLQFQAGIALFLVGLYLKMRRIWRKKNKLHRIRKSWFAAENDISSAKINLETDLATAQHLQVSNVLWELRTASIALTINNVNTPNSHSPSCTLNSRRFVWSFFCASFVFLLLYAVFFHADWRDFLSFKNGCCGQLHRQICGLTVFTFNYNFLFSFHLKKKPPINLDQSQRTYTRKIELHAKRSNKNQVIIMMI